MHIDDASCVVDQAGCTGSNMPLTRSAIVLATRFSLIASQSLKPVTSVQKTPARKSQFGAAFQVQFGACSAMGSGPWLGLIG